MTNRYLKYIKRGILPLLIVFLASCNTLSNYERTYTENGKQIVARDKGVEVQVLDQQGFLDIYYVNANDKSKCIFVEWEVYDLEPAISKGLVYVKANSTKWVGYFTNLSWYFDKVTATVGGSGRVQSFYVVPPYKDRTDCLFPKGEIS